MKSAMIASLILIVFSFSLISCQHGKSGENEEALMKKARKLSQKILVMDSHIDMPYRLMHHNEDLSVRTRDGHFDYPRAREGGLDAAFMAVFTPVSYQETGGAKAFADSVIDKMYELAGKYPQKFSIVRTPEELRANFKTGRISMALGMENGAPIENDLTNIRHFYDRGIRYVTLCHATDNQICDASFDEQRKWHGLSPFGKKVVAEMNRLGMLIDVSHISDEAFYQVMELSRAPVVATHSGCRYFTPGFERNMDDDMIKLLAEKGGVIQITFGSFFLKNEYRFRSEAVRDHIRNYLKERNLAYDDSEAVAYRKEYMAKNSDNPGTVAELVDHIEHVIQLVGIDHVGLGSDFDGVGQLPIGIEDVSKYPNIIFELLKRGYSEEDIRKICGENFLRVWDSVQKQARAV